jgi:hypothetical protein
VVDIPSEADLFLIKRMEAGESMALELPGSDLTLFVQQLVKVVDDGAGKSRLNTISYQYRLQTEDSTRSLIRWEYNRKPAPADYEYPPAHVHFHGMLDGEDATRFHVPTGRMPLEFVVWHLISDWQVAPLVKNWQAILEESIEGFGRRFSSYP